MENRQYAEMLSAATARLAGMDPARIAENTGAIYDPARNAITLETFGEAVALDCGDWRAIPALEMWHHLVLLQYLAAADGSLPGDRWIGMAEVPGGGESRGVSFDREIDRIIAARLGDCGLDDLKSACAKAGGVIQPNGRADLSAVFRLAPRWPLLVNLWVADDEFPASGKVLLNAAVCGCLGLEAAGTAATLLVNRLADLL